MRRLYFVHWGSNDSYLTHTKTFNSLKEARNFIATLSAPVAYTLTSQSFDNNWNRSSKVKILKQEIRI